MESISTQGVAITRLGFGTFRMPGNDAQPVVERAIAFGYRHIDTWLLKANYRDMQSQIKRARYDIDYLSGYEAVSFSDSHAALAAFEAAPGQFDVVISDEDMPGLTGTGLVRVLRHRQPGLPIVLMGGYSGAILTKDALAAGVSELLTKPLQSREIATVLARVLKYKT